MRWLDRCFAAHRRPHDQNLFPIVQGGLDTSPGGLRDICLAGFRLRDDKAPGYAIGGLAGKSAFVLFYHVHMCVQCEVLVIWLLYLSLHCIHLFALATHMY